MLSTSREAQLRPEYAARYPNLRSGTWMPAERALANVVGLENEDNGGGTIGLRLSDQHFTFRGGHPRGTDNRLRTRAVDAR